MKLGTSLKLSDWKIRSKVLLACTLPLVAMLGFVAVLLLELKDTADRSRTLAVVAEFAPKVSALVHELQKERGTSAGFIGSKGSKFGDVLPQQRVASDKALKTLNDAFGEISNRKEYAVLAEKIGEAGEQLNGLQSVRAQVDAHEIPVGKMAKYYTPLIAKLLSAVETMKHVAKDGEVFGQVVAYMSILQGKERAGIERAMGANGFGRGAFSDKVYQRFVKLGAAQATFFNTYNAYAAADQRKVFADQTSGPVEDEVRRLREIAYASVFGGSLQDVTGPEWFKKSTERIDRLKVVEDQLAGDLRTLADAKASAASFTLYLDSILAGAVALVVLIVMLTVTRSIVRPIRSLEGDMKELADGNLDVGLEGAERGDEIGDMTKAVVVFRDNAAERRRLAEAAENDVRLNAERQRRVEELVAKFEGAVSEVLNAVSANTDQMEECADTLTGAADNTSQKTNGASEASASASSNVQNVAAAAEELTASIQEIGHQVTQTTSVVAKASEVTDETNQKVGSLASAVGKIGDVVSMIEDIAEQTNLLALNATIESARAGEMGKGFAVVASEVKTLANQTAEATTEIAQQISDIQVSTTDAVDAIAAISSTMKEVSEYTNAIAAAVEEQGAATQEISGNVQKAADSTEDAASNMSVVSAAVGETLQAANQVRVTSTDVSSQAQQLRSEIDEFLKAVAAA